MVLVDLVQLANHNEAAEDYARLVRHGAKVSWNMRGAWLLQEANRACDPILDPNCSSERTKICILLISLFATIFMVACAFNFFREEKEESLTPLCPQLVVKDTELNFRFPQPPPKSEAETGNNFDVIDDSNPAKCVCKISMDWPDPFRGSPHGVAATVRITKADMTLATIVARNVAVMGQGLALCRTGCEIFGFVQPAEGKKYHISHRTGVHLLTLHAGGEFDDWDIEGYNPVGQKVCSLKKVGNECVGKIHQYVDAGLVISAVMAIYVNRRLSQPLPPMVRSPRALLPTSQAPTAPDFPEPPHEQVDFGRDDRVSAECAAPPAEEVVNKPPAAG